MLPNGRGNTGFPKTDPWKAINLESYNQSNNNRVIRPLQAYSAGKTASALVYFITDFFTVVVSHQSRIFAQAKPALKTDRENSGFSRQN